LKNNQPLTLKIFFMKKPLQNTDVKVWHRLAGSTLLQCLRTDKRGELRIKVNTMGKWMVSTVRMNPLQSNAKADWQSYWGSLTWGY
jgi:uncharacterized GH25 family protein